MRSYLICALVIGLFAASGCGGGGRSNPDARDGGGDGKGDGNANPDRADVGSGTGGSAGSGGTGGSVGGTGGALGGTGGSNDAAAGNDGGMPTCNDGIKNSDETSIDCGGHCGKCGPGDACLVNADCMFACKADKTCAECNVAADCQGTESECQHRTCTAGVCGSMLETAGTVLAVQTTGDCKRRQCAGDGMVAIVNDDTDLPNDSNPCTNDICTSGLASHTMMPADSTCGSGNHCNANGQCVGCTVATECPGTDTECHQRTCSAAGVCGFSNTAAGTKLVDPTAGDCKGLQCDGQGNSQVFNDNGDLPVDTNVCTTDECSSGTPSHRPVASGMSCGGSKVCDGAANCVECLSAISCPGTDTECKSRSCILGLCGITNAAAGTLTAAQTPRDCKKNVCSGGAPITVNDDLDLPVDGNPCTNDNCSNGTPSNTLVAVGVSCGTNTICDGQGACVSCLNASSCPGTDTDCHHRTCVNGACGIVNTAAGTPISAQMPGDCKVVQCDDAGQTRILNDDTDKPVDGNACTDDVCTSGVPSNPNLSSGTTCGNGLMCNGQGNCVGCITAANCGTDTTCQTHTCTNSMCGVTNAPVGTLLPAQSQTAGDCKKVQCDGMGQIQTVTDDTDKPVDGNACTQDLCNGGIATNPAEPAGTACGMGGGTKCNGSTTAPACVQCVNASDCPGTDTECHHRTCTNGTCAIANEADGKLLAAQTTGDCKKNVCMAGAPAVLNNDVDPLVDGNGCTMDLCMNGMPSNPPLAANAPCNENGGTRCNGSPTAPACVQCLTNIDCGVNTDCQMHVCSGTGQCGTVNAPNGTLTSNQTPGNCKKNVCNGSGAPGDVVDATDTPNDNNTCTFDVCTNGNPSNPSKASGAPCSQGGGIVCNGSLTAPACVACVQNSDCGTDTACKTFTCSGSNTCSSTNTNDGTLVTNTPAGDCHKDVCMGGATTTVIDNNDVPVDGKLCTNDVCMNGVPSNPNLNAGVTCGTNLMCDGQGACVGCITAADCPQGNACQVRVCLSGGMCGFTNLANGTVLSTQIPGDCHQDICTNGAVTNVVDNTDVLVDNNPCTQDLCSAGVPQNPPFGAGVACSVGSGTLCDGAGNCVECLDATTCPGGPDTECHARTCSASGICGISDQPDGTAAPGGTTGDCQKNVCDGMGGVHSVADDLDLPDTNDCRSAMCVAGVPMTPVKPKGASCATNGHICDGGGACFDTFCVLRIDGTSNSASAMSIEEHRLDGSLFSTTALPTATAGGNFAIAGSGSAASDGGLSLSGDGRYLIVAGYGATPGTASVSSTAGINRIVARIAADGTVNSSTSINSATAFTTNNVRGATSQDGTAFWVGGNGASSTGGIWYVMLGGGGLMNVLNNPANTRWPHVINGQLYSTAQTGNFNTVFTVGTGLPTTAGQTATILPGLPVTGPSPFSFVFFDRDSTPGFDTLYISDDGNGANQGIQKWTLSQTGTCTNGPPCWTKAPTNFNLSTAVDFKGVAGLIVNGNVFLMATTDEGTTSRLVTFVDTGSGAPTTTIIGPSPAGQIYRGVAVSPHL